MPATIAVPLITGAVGAATTVAGAKMASGAAKDAAKTQSQAADRAMAAQQAGYLQQRSDFNPYLQTGQAALGRLGQTAGTYTGGMPQQGPPAGQPMQGPQGPPTMNMGQLGMQGPPPGGQFNPTGVDIGTRQPPTLNQYSAALAATAPQGAQMGQQGGGMVRVQAPTGEIAMLPQAQAQQAVQRGARIIGPGGPQGAMRPGMV